MGEASYLAAMLENLGVAARLDGIEKPLQPGPVDLSALVERLLARHRPLAARRDVALDGAGPGSPTMVEADLALLEQALGNLVYNAVTYNAAGGHVAVTLHAHGGGWELRVLDDGPGIPPDELARVTERGYRGAGSRAIASKGHGLGLHITSSVLALHGFSLELTNPPEGGLLARVRGPLG